MHRLLLHLVGNGFFATGAGIGKVMIDILSDESFVKLFALIIIALLGLLERPVLRRLSNAARNPKFAIFCADAAGFLRRPAVRVLAVLILLVFVFWIARRTSGGDGFPSLIGWYESTDRQTIVYVPPIVSDDSPIVVVCQAPLSNLRYPTFTTLSRQTFEIRDPKQTAQGEIEGRMICSDDRVTDRGRATLKKVGNHALSVKIEATGEASSDQLLLSPESLAIGGSSASIVDGGK